MDKFVQVAFPSLKKMEIQSTSKFKRIWSDQLTQDSFCKLEDVEFITCGNLTNIFPSSMLGRLGSLTTLTVWECKMVEGIFQIPISDVQEACNITHTQLSYLHLYRLPNLKHVWSKDPRGILTTKNLNKIYIYECPDLENLFPYSVAKGLLKLEILCIIECGIKEIVAEEEGLTAKPKFVFPQLTDLRLLNVPQLVSFYPGMHTSEWPLLKWLVVSGCIAEVFALETHRLAHHGTPIQQHYLFLTDKVRDFIIWQCDILLYYYNFFWSTEYTNIIILNPYYIY